MQIIQYSAKPNFFTTEKSRQYSKSMSYFELHLSTDSHNIMLNWKFFIEKNPVNCKQKVNKYMKQIKLVSALNAANLLLIQRVRHFHLIFTLSNSGEI